MKFAFLMTGCERTFEYCFPSIQKWVLEPYKPDMFICMDTAKESRFRDLYNPVAMHVVSPEERQQAIGDTPNRFSQYKAPEAVISHNVAALYQHKTVWKLFKQYGKHYDVVFIGRPDVEIYHLNHDFNVPLKPDTYYEPYQDALGTVQSNGIYYGGWGGQLAFGTERVAEVFCSTYDNMEHLYTEYKDWHTERMWRHQFQEHNIGVATFGIDFKIIRTWQIPD